MARLFVYDSAAGRGSLGVTVNPTDGVIVAGTAYRTRPVRLASASGAIDRVGWEIMLSGGAGTQLVQWYQEYYGDRSAPPFGGNNRFPSQRDSPGLDATAPWLREQNEEIAPGGTITHNNVTHEVTFNVPAGGVDARYFPMVVHTIFVRLALVIQALTIGAPRVRIWAHVGGYGSPGAHESAVYPYDYENE